MSDKFRILGDDNTNPPDTDHTYDVNGVPHFPSGVTTHVGNDSDVIVAIYNPFCVLGYTTDTWNVVQEVTSADTHSPGWSIKATVDGISFTIPRNAQRGNYLGNVRTPWLDDKKSIVTCRHVYFGIGDPADVDFTYDPLKNCFVIADEDSGALPRDFPAFLWWVGNEWIYKSTKPSDNTIYLSRTVVDGVISFCAGCIDHFPADNDAFVWNSASSSYLYLLSQFKNIYGVQLPGSSLVQYLIWDGTSCWKPSNTVATGDLYMERFSDTLTVGYRMGDGLVLPYAIVDENSAIEYSKHRPWCLRTKPEPIFVWNELHNSYRAFKENLLYENAAAYADFPEYLKWESISWSSSDSLPDSPYCKKVDDDISSPYVNYELFGDKPYDNEDPCNIAVAKKDDSWIPVNITMPEFVFDPDCNCFCAAISSLSGTLVMNPSTDLPPYLIWDGTCWEPSTTPPSDPNTPYLVLTVTDGVACYSLPPGWEMPYSISDTNNTIQIGDGTWCPNHKNPVVLTYDPSCNCVSVNIGDIDPSTLPNYLFWNGDCWKSYGNIPLSGGTILEKVVGDEKIFYYLHNLPPLASLMIPALKKLSFGINNDLINYYNWDNTNKKWDENSTIPLSNQILEKSENNGVPYYFIYGLYTTESIYGLLPIILSKSSSNNPKQFLYYNDTSGIWIDSISNGNPSLFYEYSMETGFVLNGDMEINSFLSLLGQSIASGEDDSTLSPYLLQLSAGSWSPSTNVPTENSTLYFGLGEPVSSVWSYSLKGGLTENPVWPYDITAWVSRSITLKTDCGYVTPKDPPVFVWDPGCECFCIDIDNLEDNYSISDPPGLPQYLYYDEISKCWKVWTDTVNLPPEPYLVLVINDTKVCYDLVGSLPTDYDVTQFPGITMGGGNTNWCPVVVVDPPFFWDPNCQCFCANIIDLLSYGLFPENLPPFLVWNGTCWVGSETCPTSSKCLEILVSATQVCYQVTEPDGMPYDPEATNGLGSAIEWGWDNQACPFHPDYPPYNFNECPILRFEGSRVIRGMLDQSGDFRPCDPIDAWEAIDGMPDGTAYKEINLYCHNNSTTTIYLGDNTDDFKLLNEDSKFFTAWYRFTDESYDPTAQGNGPGSGAEKAWLQTFNNRIKYNNIEKFKSTHTVNITVIILVTPNVYPIDKTLPTLIKIN